MWRELSAQDQAFLSTSPPSAGERRSALVVVCASVAVFIVAIPFAKVQLEPVAGFIPAYQSALVVCDVITAVLLFGQYRVLRSTALLVLAVGYLFTAFTAFAHTLSFPGLFAPTGLLGAGPQTTAWLYMFWHGAFPCFVMAYAVLKHQQAPRGGSPRRFAVAGAIIVAAALAAAFTLLATAGQHALPPIMQGNRYTPAMTVVVGVTWALSIVALAVLWRRKPHSVLDLWLLVTVSACIFDIALSAVLNAGRFDVGFYAGRIYGLLAASFVLIVLLARTGVLYTQMIEASVRERRRVIDLERLSAELAQARTDAEQASRAKSSFLAMMSHEIRTPMNGVIGMVEVLARSGLSEQQQDEVKTIRDSATTLLGIIDDILDFSKIEAGRLQIEQAPLSIADLVEGIANSLLPVATRRGVMLDVFVAPDLPQRVLSDDVRLRQVLYNLVGNAIKFSARPNRAGRVAIRAEAASAMPLKVAFSIADNGIGMSAATLDALFTPFTQAEQRRFGGTGLGLSISKRLVDLMEGEINVVSQAGAGSTFTVTLPLAVPAEQPIVPLADLAGIECVVVPSDDFVADDVRIYLEREGAAVRIAEDPRAAALAAADASRIVVVICGHEADDPQLAASLDALPNLRALVIARAAQRRELGTRSQVVALEGNALRRAALLRAVAVAAGRASPEIARPPDDVAAETLASPPTVAEARERGRLILVVEDDEINKKVISQQLNLLGFAAEIADNGIEALRRWREGDYALILTDLHMPEMDGYELAETVRREEDGRRHVPILALTANALRGEAHRARASGMNDYLTKPVQLHVLRAALAKWLPKDGAHSAPPSSPARASAPAAGGPPVVDIAVLRALIGDDAEMQQGILADYLASARRLAAELRSAWADEDVERVRAIAHKLKSSSRSVGALDFGNMCAEIETAGRAGDLAVVANEVSRFEATFAEVETNVAAILAHR